MNIRRVRQQPRLKMAKAPVGYTKLKSVVEGSKKPLDQQKTKGGEVNQNGLPEENKWKPPATRVNVVK